MHPTSPANPYDATPYVHAFSSLLQTLKKTAYMGNSEYTAEESVEMSSSVKKGYSTDE